MNEFVLYLTDYRGNEDCDGPRRTREEAERDGERHMAKIGHTGSYRVEERPVSEDSLFPGEYPSDYNGPFITTPTVRRW